MRNDFDRGVFPKFSGWNRARRPAQRATPGLSRESAGLAGLLLLAILPVAGAQEIPRPSVTRQKVQQSLPTVSNFRVGQVLMRIDARVGVEFVDNVDLTPTGSPDFIVTPEIGVNATWAVTKQNTLRFRASVGYSNYFNHPRLNRQSVQISPDSALSFDVYAGDVKINFHEQFSLQDESINQGALSGVAQLGRFTNTIGTRILWDMNDVILSLGYDHFNFITTGGADSSAGSLAANIAQLDHSTDQLSTSASFKLNSVALGGIEITGSSSAYPKSSASDFTSLSAGPYLELQLTRYTHLFVSAGYKSFTSAGGGAPAAVSLDPSVAVPSRGGTQAGYYTNLSFIHTLNRYYGDRLDIGHSDEADALNGQAQTNFARYQSTWKVNSKVTLNFGLFLEDVHEVTGTALNGLIPSDYWRSGVSVGTGYRLTEHVGLGLGYQFTTKHSQRADQNYSQNSVRISLGYQF